MRQIDPRMAKLEQRTQGVMALMVLILAVLLIQLWLLTIALEEFMAAHTALALPTFGASAFCFLLNLWMLRYLVTLDKKEDKP
ncbi:MAG TPA: DUF6755 family protein [Chthonomonadaceae bacterium]|nr:DUF6755 family protein [Chthonomonadaceae bacterium]